MGGRLRRDNFVRSKFLGARLWTKTLWGQNYVGPKFGELNFVDMSVQGKNSWSKVCFFGFQICEAKGFASKLRGPKSRGPIFRGP